MKYDLLYQTIIENLNYKICDIWPDQAFAAASWDDIALNIEKVYKKHAATTHSVPHQICLGYIDEAPDGTKLAKISGGLQGRVPLLFNWCSYRGLYVCAADSSVSLANQTAAALVLRVLLHTDKDGVLVHKVDPQGLGKDLGTLPQQIEAPIIVDNEGLESLISRLRTQIANHPIDAQSWRCDITENAFAADSQALQIVLIANWDDLYEVRMGKKELSNAQKNIITMLSSDVPARNGIYFVICGNTVGEQSCFADVLPLLSIDCKNIADSQEDLPYSAFLSSSVVPDRPLGNQDLPRNYSYRFSLPISEQLQIILKAQRNFQSGMLSDTDGEGLWLGNTAKGLRAIMGITPQGENQFFELGVGQAGDAFHALIGGATGSGKSVLLSEIICSLAERYSPKELRMLLLDYKEGTEFASFKQLPHVYALSVGANIEFGLEVLKEVQKEIARRGLLFKEVNAKNLDEYRRLTGEIMCRYVLVADEFQVLLGDKKVGAEAKTVLNDLVRRGRSFGFHAILSTQTLRDGSLDGEAKNQFGCRIALRMAESETDYFLASGNAVPASFSRKGQALVNYALGRKESNIVFQSGNKELPNKYRDTCAVLQTVNQLHDKAIAECCMPDDRFIYDNDGFAARPVGSNRPGELAAGIVLGLRNNMQSTPVMLSTRQLSGKVLVLGGNKHKQQVVLNNMAAQLSELYQERVCVQTPADYLDYPTGSQVTILDVPEGDFDFEDAIQEWKASAPVLNQQVVEPEPAAIPYTAPAGMEADFAALMQSMQANNAMLNATAQPNPVPRRARNRDTRCLIVALSTVADIRLMEAAGMYTNDFRTIVYLDHVMYNQISGDYESSVLGESIALLESPKGVVTKIRLIQ